MNTDPKKRKKNGQITAKEIEIFKKTEDAQINAQTQDKPGFPFFAVCGRVHLAGAIKIDSSAEHQKTKEPPIPAPVEKITRRKQDKVLRLTARHAVNNIN